MAVDIIIDAIIASDKNHILRNENNISVFMELFMSAADNRYSESTQFIHPNNNDSPKFTISVTKTAKEAHMSVYTVSDKNYIHIVLSSLISVDVDKCISIVRSVFKPEKIEFTHRRWLLI